jgi:hypothetical protein
LIDEFSMHMHREFVMAFSSPGPGPPVGVRDMARDMACDGFKPEA